jgi:putative transposase
MLVNKAYRYELAPNNIQRSSLAQHAGVSRFTYNWGLEQRIARYKNNQGDDRFPDAMKQHKLLTSLKKNRVLMDVRNLEVCTAGNPERPP